MIINILTVPKSFDDLWKDFQKLNNTKKSPTFHTLDSFVTTLTFLYIIGAITEDQKGVIKLCD